jgi:hypothetical protein
MKKKVYTPDGIVQIECLPIADGHGYIALVREGGSSQVYTTNNGFMMFCAERFDEKKAMDVLAEFGELEG